MTKVSQKQARLQSLYKEKIKSEVQKELALGSIMEVPELKKIVVNVSTSRAVAEPKVLDSLLTELGTITGQLPVKTKARNSIATFKLREGMPIGVMVTLRGKIMYEFLDRLVNVALPRVRDFNGLSNKSFDHSGNYSFSIKEQIIFPEINVDQAESIHGMNITLTIKSKSPEHSMLLLRKFNFPFRNK